MGTERLVERIAELSRPLAPLVTGAEMRPLRCGPMRAVLFDIYGTLFISGSGDVGTAAAGNTAEAAREALIATGLSTPENAPDGGEVVALYEAAVRDSHRQYMAEHPTVQSPEVEIRDVWQEVLKSLALAVCANTVERLAVEYECRVNPVWPMPHAKAAIRAIRNGGLALGIVSNSQFYTPLLFPALLGGTVAGLGFDDDLSAWSYRLLEAKPSPRLFEQALEGLQRKHAIRPDETLYVGNDMRNDVWTASQAGCRTALFAGDQRSLRWRRDDPRCTDLHPDATLTDLSQLAPQLAL